MSWEGNGIYDVGAAKHHVEWESEDDRRGGCCDKETWRSVCLGHPLTFSDGSSQVK